MPKSALGLLASALLLFPACESLTSSETPFVPPPMVAGGSNYGMYSVGTYLQNPTEAVWYKPLELRPVIATLHLDSLRVQSQLREMHANGQRRVALVLWFGDFSKDSTLAGQTVHGHILDSSLRRLNPQHERNLRHLLRMIQGVGYEEVILRFAHQGSSHPHDWPGWLEDRYQDNWSFISSTRETTEAAVDHAKMRVIYDLGVELGGIHHLGHGRPYTTRIWADWVKRYGNRRTVAFSIPLGTGVVEAAIRTFDRAGKRPEMIAVSLYQDEGDALRRLHRELRNVGAERMPIIIQETWYNDTTYARVIQDARRELNLDIRYVVQWPLHRGAHQPHFSMDFPAQYDAYR